jgi:SAM-dependent methyltransferase
MTWLNSNPELWDAVFREPADRLAFVDRQLRGVRGPVLDVGCATGNLCLHLRDRGMIVVGVDVNPKFIRAARAKDPIGQYREGDMRTLRLRRKFDAILCLGTTLAYARTNEDVLSTLAGFHKHLVAGGKLIVDVLNASALLGPRRFRPETRHVFTVRGERLSATIAHRLRLKDQFLTEQVTWRGLSKGRRGVRRDAESSLRLFFPQELSLMLRVSGFSRVIIQDGYGGVSDEFAGRRLVAVAKKDGDRRGPDRPKL